MPERIQIAVRALVEYVFRAGSIDSRFRTTSSLTEGTKAHQKIQKLYQEHDLKEVYLSTEIAIGDLLFVIDGRCDGLLAPSQHTETEGDAKANYTTRMEHLEGATHVGAASGLFTIDEIKSTGMAVDLITEQMYPVHWAQAKCYAYMYAKANGVERMRVQLTYVQVDTEQQQRFVQEVTRQELEHFVMDVVSKYAPYAEMLQRHTNKRDSSIQQLDFPFEAYREGQRKLAGAVYQSIEAGGKLFAKAPTGIGKTISTIFPSLKAMGKGLLQRIFYLTARTITRTAAEDAFALMQASGLHIHTVTLTAKDKICFQDEVRCTKEHCEFADGYYDRINGALLDLLANETLMTRPVIEQYARKHRVCPFEMSLDAAYAADVIIGDYNYVFDPRIALKRLLAEHKKQTVLLVDEAHNLVDRAREMFSATLHKSAFLEVQRVYKVVNIDVSKAAKAVNAQFIALRKQSEEPVRIDRELPKELLEEVEAFIVQAEKALLAQGQDRGALTANPMLLEIYFAAQSFVRIASLYDQRYVTYAECSKSEVQLKLFCLDPSYLLQQMGKGYRSHIYFSATLTPFSYFMNMLGAGDEDYTISIPSPFNREQLEIVVQPLSTRYHDRERTKAPLVQMLHRLLETSPGNYLFFFPSYAYMNDVYEAFMLEAGDAHLHAQTGAQTHLYKQTILQHPDMTEEARESFLAAFTADKEQAFAGFAVMGGIFSEGIDLVGDRLNGVVVVGVGLPQIGLERNIIKEYFNSSGYNGYDYAYVFPGMNKVLQAGGRLIRSEQDHGKLVLVDDRYLQPQYQRLLPEEWKHYKKERL
ncbi:ATP-dependent DNA helicase [Paenibacillus sp. S3N08]|uniref:ATP-dependent DNA helicase n=1 Tax=Paenibacillus agricola TaxID=2716264 RepID=A0ABX0J8D5_9BACL|nr:ATP-dependent DNA helicase [Paenibacillus agricola]